MVNDPKKYPQKTYCYLNKCKPVRTGFHLENYPSCSYCKMELSEKLYKNLIDKQKDVDDIQDQIDRMFDEQI